MISSSNFEPDEHYIPNCSTTGWGTIATYGEKKLSVLNINIRSIANKFSEFKAHLNSIKNKFTFIVITETWLKEPLDFAFEIEGYKSVSLYRDGRQGGGIKIYHLERIVATFMSELSGCTGSCEKLFLKASVAGIGKLVLVESTVLRLRPCTQFSSNLFSSNYFRPIHVVQSY